MTFNPLDHPLCWTEPLRLAPTHWADHLPFGMVLIDLLRPRTIVELGTSTGVSYCGFCQAVKSLHLDARCCAIDNWNGVSAGNAGPDDLRDLKAHHDHLYSGFSRLIQSSFDLARGQFANQSVDLLHLDGAPQYEHVKHDFEHWRSVVSDRGVVLFHNISARGPGFGVYRLWDELRSKYPYFELPHGRGLGLLGVGARSGDSLRELLCASDRDRQRLQHFFAQQGRSLQDRVRRDAHEARLATALGAAEIAARDRAARVDEIASQRDDAVTWLRTELTAERTVRRSAEAWATWLHDTLDEIYNSRGWLWLMRYRGVKERLGLPKRQPPRRRPLVVVAQQETAPAEAKPRPLPVAGSAPAGGTVGGIYTRAHAVDGYASLTLLPGLETDEAAMVVQHGHGQARPSQMDVICFSIIDWEFRYQRPQHVMSQFAAHGHRVFFISPSRFRHGATASEPEVRRIKDNVYEVQLSAPRTPNVYGERFDGATRESLLGSLAALRRTYDISSAVAYVMVASWTDVALEAGRRWHWPVAYDCMDEWENFQGIKPALLDAERDLVRKCDLLIVTGSRLYEKWKPFGRPMTLARNAVDHEFYLTRCVPNSLLPDTPRPIIGYFGAIAAWFDVDLLAHAARERPHYSFVLLGGVFDVDVTPLTDLPNVTLLGQQPYESMPQYLYHFAVCVIPFKVNKTTDATDPVKLYEYLSAGKPVVSVTLPELERCREYLYLATDRNDFVVQLDRAVAEDDRDKEARRREFAARHTWTDRYRHIATAITNVSRRASVVIVTYNNLLLTQLCLESVLCNTDHPNYEVIVVDNASTDGTQQYLRDLAERHAHVRLILNAANEGFPRGNNQGLRESQGDDLVLLNNDTVVPPGWLARLLAHLRNPEVGLVGPVTNFAGNEAGVEVPYRSWAQMERYAAERARQYDGQLADITMLAMFCLAMRRDAYERIGPLDERFGIGMFEDDDYARRALANKYRVVCAADVFVHHVGQAAFRALVERGEYDGVFERNRRYFEDKWGVSWQPHQRAPLAFSQPRDQASAVVEELSGVDR